MHPTQFFGVEKIYNMQVRQTTSKNHIFKMHDLPCHVQMGQIHNKHARARLIKQDHIQRQQKINLLFFTSSQHNLSKVSILMVDMPTKTDTSINSASSRTQSDSFPNIDI